MAAAFNISERRLRQLVTQEKIPRASRGKGYPIFECVCGYVLYLQEQKPESGSKYEEETRLRRAQADRQELEIAVKRRTLIDSAELDQAIMAAGVMVTSGLDALPGRLAAPLARETSPARVKKRIQGETRRIRSLMVGKLRTYCRALEEEGKAAQ